MNQSSFTCLFTDVERRLWRKEVIEQLFKHVIEFAELDDGYGFKFPEGDTWARRVVDFINFERKCCPFFTFELVVKPGQGAIWLQLRGTPGVKAFILKELAGLRVCVCERKETNLNIPAAPVSSAQASVPGE